MKSTENYRNDDDGARRREEQTMGGIPNPAQLAATRAAAKQAEADAAVERERVKRVRSRRRARRGAVLRSHVDEETLGVLAKLAHPSRGEGV